MISFQDFLEQTDEETRKKLELIKSILSGNKAYSTKLVDDGNNLYVYLDIKPINDLIKRFANLNLGIKISSLGNRLIYRLYQNEKTPIGPGKNAEDPEEVKKEIQSGKQEENVHRDIYTKSAEEIAKFTDNVFKNLESRTRGNNNPNEMDAEYQRSVLNAIVSTVLGK